jgi:hypothetical protein
MKRASFLIAFGLTGCLASPAEDGAERFDETVVVLREGAEPEIVASGLGPKAVDRTYSCDGADLQLWDRTDRTGNTICFIGTGRVDLRNYYLPPQNCTSRLSCYVAPWAGRARSYRMGPMPKVVRTLAQPAAAIFGNGVCQECVAAGTSRTLGSCGQSANAIDVIGLYPYVHARPAACR